DLPELFDASRADESLEWRIRLTTTHTVASAIPHLLPTLPARLVDGGVHGFGWRLAGEQRPPAAADRHEHAPCIAVIGDDRHHVALNAEPPPLCIDRILPRRVEGGGGRRRGVCVDQWAQAVSVSFHGRVEEMFIVCDAVLGPVR